jgi:hypothetical protein
MITGSFFHRRIRKTIGTAKAGASAGDNVGYLLNAANPANQFRRPVDDAARALGLKLAIIPPWWR